MRLMQNIIYFNIVFSISVSMPMQMAKPIGNARLAIETCTDVSSRYSRMSMQKIMEEVKQPLMWKEANERANVDVLIRCCKNLHNKLTRVRIGVPDFLKMRPDEIIEMANKEKIADVIKEKVGHCVESQSKCISQLNKSSLNVSSLIFNPFGTIIGLELLAIVGVLTYQGISHYFQKADSKETKELAQNKTNKELKTKNIPSTLPLKACL